MPIGSNICVAPFVQLTYSPLGSASPCPYLGGEAWNLNNLSLKQIWESDQYNELRQSFLRNERNPTCSRCWKEEDHGKQSARKLCLASYEYKKGLLKKIEDGDYNLQHLSLRVSNLCNLRCRSCGSASSSTYSVEGRYYEKKNGIEAKNYTRYPKVFEFSDQQIEEIFQSSKHLKKISFYGGEPLLDKPTLKLLSMLIDNDQSKEIKLYYNTNGVNTPTDEHLSLWKNFKDLELKFSIDGIGDHFSYIRHPGSWQDLLENLRFCQDDLSTILGIPVTVGVICTVTSLNVFYLPEILDEFKSLKLDCFLNLAEHPKYYNLKNYPESVKEKIIEKLLPISHKSEIMSIINLLKSEQDPQAWEQFKFWTREKDAYRKESFSQTFPEIYSIIKSVDPDFPG